MIDPFEDVDFSYCDKVLGDFISSSKNYLLTALKD